MKRMIWMFWAGALLAQAGEYEFSPAPGAHLTLTVEKTGVWSGRKHTFEFGRYGARVVFDAEAPARSSVDLSIDAASAVCQDTWVSEKDRTKILAVMRGEMLDVEHHPLLRFRSERVEARGGGKFEIRGMLAIRGIEKPVALMAALETRDGVVAGVSGTAVVKLKDYGLTPPKAALGMIGTKNEMTVDFRLLAGGPTR